MITAVVRGKLEREIRRTEDHLNALYDLLEEIEKEVPKRKVAGTVTSRIPLIEEALSKVQGNRIFSVKEATAFAQRIEPDNDRRLIYNCIKGYLQRGVQKGLFEQMSDTEYRRLNFEQLDTALMHKRPPRKRSVGGLFRKRIS